MLVAGQTPSGALVASPTLPVYRYAWLRDGAFCAMALGVAGHAEAAGTFHRWVTRTILAGRDLAEAAIRAVRAGREDPPHLPTRYTMSGQSESDPDRAWPNFQLDGYGVWLCALAAHADRSDQSVLPAEVTDAVRLIGRYLAAMWPVPCYDCWEERGHGHHTSTLLAVGAGLAAAARLVDEPGFDQAAGRISEVLAAEHMEGGRLIKSRLDPRVDASLLWAGASMDLPGVTGPEVVAGTVEAVLSELLVPGGGVRRYLGDSYYGGGEWLLLTSWLGWHAVLAGNRRLAEHCDRWVRAQATAGGELTEQVTSHPQFPEMVQPWIHRRGPVAVPLLWSHAMQIIHSAAMTQAGWLPAS